MRVKACCRGGHIFKNMRLVILLDMFLNHSFKITISFANIAKLQLAQVNLYTRKDLKNYKL